MHPRNFASSRFTSKEASAERKLRIITHVVNRHCFMHHSQVLITIQKQNPVQILVRVRFCFPGHLLSVIFDMVAEQANKAIICVSRPDQMVSPHERRRSHHGSNLIQRRHSENGHVQGVSSPPSSKKSRKTNHQVNKKKQTKTKNSKQKTQIKKFRNRKQKDSRSCDRNHVTR